MKSSLLNQFITICNDELANSSTKLRKNFKTFIIETLILYMVIPSRINFLQLGRYSESCEQRFRQNFSKNFDWLTFNVNLSKRILTGKRKAIAIDPSFISKSGKHTPCIGYFWSGCAGAAKRGLEILGVALIDIDNKDCVTLQATQTVDSLTLANEDENKTLIDWYLAVLNTVKDKLHSLSNYIVADAYFAKRNFVKGLEALGFYLVSRLRDDAQLLYPTQEKPTGRKGRPKLYDGKIDFSNLDMSKVERLSSIDNGELYSLVAYSKSLKQLVKLVVWYSKDKRKWKLYFSTNEKMSGKDVIEYYRTRFQIEFCFRNAKQFTGLNHCQARDINKLNFNFNASLSCVNIAKVMAKENGIPFSLASTKVLIHNAYLLDRFIRLSGIRPNRRLNERLIREIVEFNAIIA